MKAIGIVAEFNPFHNGHAYIIEQAKKQTESDYVIVAMSGDFVQRGEPACVDKYVRTKMALNAGADVVFELPTIFATASAEYFARGAVSMLAGTGVVKQICFGTEHPDLPYAHIAKLLIDEPDSYKDKLKEVLGLGESFPSARAKAILHALETQSTSLGSCITEETLAEPNTILGIEYAKAALHYDMKLIPIKRQGNSYHDDSLEGEYLSAGAIRRQLLASPGKITLSGISSQNQEMLRQYLTAKKLLSPDSLSDLLYQELLRGSENGYELFFDCDADLSNRIQKLLQNYHTFSEFVADLKTKRYTYLRISRVLLHIVLGIRDTDVTTRETPYLRLLGFRKNSSEVLGAMKEKSSLSLVSKMADAQELLSKEAYAILQKDIYAANLYEQLAFFNQPKRNEMTQSPIRLS